MVESTGVRHLRDNLTDFVIRVATQGDEVVVWRRGRPIVRLRPVEAADVWPPDPRVSRVPITLLRRHVSEILRRAMRSPLIVTWHDQPQAWLGPAAEDVADSRLHLDLPVDMDDDRSFALRAAEEGPSDAADQ
jgi:antitoxin (DNA-binding transcriptional repressor) of toxin-antitoxin stability system